MSNLLKSKTFKVGGLIIAIAMMLSVAAVASAQTTTTTTTVVASGYTYSGVMKAGMSGPGISTLQAALNEVNVGTTIVVDGKFGPATVAAVKRFQMTHGLTADGVVGPMTGAKLAAATVAVITVPGGFPAGCTSNAGFSTTTGMSCAVSFTLPAGCSSTSGFSSTTGVKCSTSSSSNLPAGCSSTSGFSSTTGVRCDGGSSSSNNGSLSGGETDINNIDLSDADDDTLNEGANKAPVAQLEFDVDDADAELLRVDVVFQAANGSSEEDPWKVFDKVYLMDGSDVVASVTADDEDMWDDADDIITSGTKQASRIRFNNVNQSYNEGDNASLWIAVDVASSVDGAGSSTTAGWTVGIDTDGLRFTDGAGLTTEAGTTDRATFSIDEAGAQSTFDVTEASNSPDANTVEVKASTSTEETVAIFKVEADEDGGDVKINDFPVGLKLTVGDGAAAGVPTFADVIDEVFVTLDGTKYTGDYVSGSCTALATTLSACTAGQTASFRFDDIDDDDVIVSAGDSMDVKVSVKLRAQGTTAVYANGTTIQAFAQLGTSDVEDADSGDDVGDVNGTATASVLTLAGTGLSIKGVSENAVRTFIGDAVGESDQGTFTIVFELTAFGDDVYIDNTAPAEDNDGTYVTTSTSYSVTNPGNNTTTGVLNATSGEFENGTNGWLIREGDTARFTLEVTVTGTTSSSAAITLENIGFALTDVDGTTSFLVPAEPEFETNSVTLLDQ